MQIPEDDVFLGRTVLERKLVSREALLECLFQCAQERKAGRPRPLGVLLVSRGLLLQEDLDAILVSRVAAGGAGERPLSEAEVGRLLVAAGLLSRENVEECVRLQEEIRRAGKVPPPLGQLAVHRGYVSEPQLRRVLGYQRKLLYECPACRVRIHAAPPPPGSRYRCRTCGSPLVPAEPEPAPAGSPLALREAERGEDTQMEIDRAVAAFLKQKDLVRRDQLREAQRLQMEFARYGLVVPLLELVRRIGAITLQQQKDLEARDFARVVRGADWKGQLVPGYRLLSRVAVGGFASIWTAEPLFGTGRVAIKVLHPERAQDPRSVARFEWEAMLLRRFECPAIVRGLDHGFERGTHYVVMEYVEGRSLGQALSETGAFPARDALALARQVAEALRYLHGQGYLHRDIKPDNVLLDAAGRAKLCDLGFSVPIPRHEGDGARPKTVVGTAGYMSPEALEGRPALGVGGDLYALGILLYALLTGHEPYTGASSQEVVTDQIESGLPVPNLMLVPAPPSVVGLLKRLMHPDPGRRFRSADEVLAALGGLAVS
jgi:hypothetical protein